MTYILPVTTGITGYTATLAMGHPIAAPFVGVGCGVAGWLSAYCGHGLHLNRRQMRKVEFFMHQSMAANWGVRPLAGQFDEGDQQALLGSMFDAVAGEQIQNLLEQWPVIWAHIQRVHFSGIPPVASMKAMKRAYRPGLFGKDKGKARELAKPVVQAYASLHPNPGSALDWYMRWAQSIGLPEEIAHQTWIEGLRSTPQAAAPSRDDSAGEVVDIQTARQEQSSRQTPRQSAGARRLSDEEIERRLAASRG